MTIFAVTRGRVENGNIFGFKRTVERVQGCKEIAPGDYRISGGFVEMDVVIGPDDSVLVAISSIMATNPITSDWNDRHIEFGGFWTALSSLRESIDSLRVIPKYGEAVLKIGPDAKGITFSLERYGSVLVAPVAVGTMAIEVALSPRPLKSKVNKTTIPTIGGGAGVG